ncbi:hypothetical protein CC80DRAFT_550621 [Byssothecium circinans]|uniref:Uncharacterized protein n=1 Tax=Byssothecium circinans TaxID=147558 RepID=A0A6A5TN75_9PLEO|nr:hypothetical protein CC80DRAFT_550621 [Byssothecium circinans]
MKTPTGMRKRICTTASFTYNFATRQMYIFMHCLDEPACANFLAAIENGTTFPNPFLVPALIIQFNLEAHLFYVDHYLDRIYMLELQLRICQNRKRNAAFMDMEFNEMTKDLYQVISKLASVVTACSTTQRQCAFLDDVAVSYYRMAMENGFEEGEAREVKDMLIDNLAQLRD